MDLSILVPIYQESKFLDKFLHRLTKQNEFSFEVIFVVDTDSENCLALIDKHKSSIKGNIKVIYNSRRLGRYNALREAILFASKTYAIIVSSTDVFKDDLVTNIDKITNENKFDIIEFNASSHRPIWFNGFIRKNIKIKDGCMTKKKKSDIFAYTYPFEFNKIIKTSIIRKAVSYPKINTSNNNSRFIVEIIFKSILIANSYYTLNRKLVRSKKINGNNYNPMAIIREWDKIISNESFKKYISPLRYNKYFSCKIIYQSYIKVLKNNTLQKKFDEFLKKFSDQDFFDSNTYILKKNKEVEVLKQYKNKDSYKAYKEL